ncbi:MAG: hypothetical protein ACJAV7_003166, partial [Flavobacteriales bacterium]
LGLGSILSLTLLDLNARHFVMQQG